MAVNFGNLAGAATSLTTALSKEKSLKSFLTNINKFGIQVKNNFEINFSGLTDITFFATTISLPTIHQNFTEISYNGRKIEVPINCDFDHDFSLTLLNDAQGYIYSALVNFIMTDSTEIMAASGYKMTIKAINGDDNYPGTLYTLNNVRIQSVGQLQYGYADNDISTFDVQCKCQDYTATPGALGSITGIMNTIESMVR